MSRFHRIGRSLGVASIGLILVSGASFAHDASSDTPSSTTWWGANQGVQAPGVEVNDRQGDDLDEVAELDQEDHVIGGTPDDINEPADAQEPPETDGSAGDKAASGQHVAVKPAKPAKAPKVHKAETTKSSDTEDANDGNEAENNDQGGDQQGSDHQDGAHDSGDQGGSGHDDSGSGGDD